MQEHDTSIKGLERFVHKFIERLCQKSMAKLQTPTANLHYDLPPKPRIKALSIVTTIIPTANENCFSSLLWRYTH
jgi:hypothetical protein